MCFFLLVPMTVCLAAIEVTVTEEKNLSDRDITMTPLVVTLPLCTPQASEEIGKDGSYGIS